MIICMRFTDLLSKIQPRNLEREMDETAKEESIQPNNDTLDNNEGSSSSSVSEIQSCCASSTIQS